MMTPKKQNEPSTAKTVGCAALMVVFGIAWISSKIPGCNQQNTEQPSPQPVVGTSATPAPTQDVILDAYQLLGQGRAEVRKYISAHGLRLSEHYARNMPDMLDGGAMDVFQGPKSVDGIEVLTSYGNDNRLNHLTVQNLAILKLHLEDTAQLLPRFGVTGLEVEPEKSPATWHWQDLRDMKVRAVETVRPSADSNDYIDFLQLKLE